MTTPLQGHPSSSRLAPPTRRRRRVRGHACSRVTHGAGLDSTRRRLAANDGGYSIVEAAIVFPAVLVMLFGVVQFALLWHGRHVAEAAAQDALRSASGYQSTATLGERDGRDFLHQVAPNLLKNPSVQVSRNATNVTVQVRANVVSLFGMHLTISETAAGPVERYVGGG